ncbi:2-dehydropantoate 2-reductase [Pseudarthrobacter sp. J1738]|uniref:2-dehydropantoate 2-reductase n=1 Tax=Pseudarthrobacter sp. J1738 TaxID=3420446 RepID=UPI003D28D80C
MTRILIVGAGATGGALGARLVAAGREVTFLVRERRTAQLAADGLRFTASGLEVSHTVQAVTALDSAGEFDVVIVAVKAPALEAILPTLAPAVGANTQIIPLLNGMAHMDLLEGAFPGRVMGGIVKIVATLDESATVVQMTPMSSLTIGSLDSTPVPAEIVEALDVEGIDLEVRENIVAGLWEKWAFIAGAGVITCLFRGSIGDILAAGGKELILRAVEECESVARTAGYPVSEAGHQLSLTLFTQAGSGFTSSLYRDLQHGDPLEAEHILGDFAARAKALGVDAPLLDAAILQLRTHHQQSLAANKM